MIEEGTGLIPIAENHHGEGASFRSWRCDSHGVLKAVRKVIFEKPVARLPQSLLPAHLVDLQVEPSLFVRGFCFHDPISRLVSNLDVTFAARLPHGSYRPIGLHR